MVFMHVVFKLGLHVLRPYSTHENVANLTSIFIYWTNKNNISEILFWPYMGQVIHVSTLLSNVLMHVLISKAELNIYCLYRSKQTRNRC